MFASLLLLVAAQDYFPLHTGNQWIYRETGLGAGSPQIVEVVRAATIEGQVYSLVAGFPGGDAWLRTDEQGTLYAYDPVTRRESVWAVFSTPEGGTYATSINECNRTAKVDSRRARVPLPIGEVSNGLTISYPAANCADAGLSSDVFLPYIGLVQRSAITIAGPRTLELIYARVGGVTVLSEPEVAFSLTLDRAVYAEKLTTPVITVRLTLRVTSDPVRLTYASGQRFDIVLKSGDGKEVYRWSDGKAFTLALGTETFGPGEQNYVVEIPLADAAGNRFAPGRYVAEGWVATMGEKSYVASVGFQIAALR